MLWHRRGIAVTIPFVLGALAACERSIAPTEPAVSPALSVPQKAGAYVTTINNEQFWADDQSGQMVPTSERDARIDNERSGA